MTAAIVNPLSGCGKTGRKWPGIHKKLQDRLGPVTTRFTRYRGHGIVLARELLEQGHDLVLAAGGDGTINEVANGFLYEDQPFRQSACLGILPMGTGGDFQRMLGIGADIHRAIDILTHAEPLEIDLGKASFRGHDGSLQQRYFVNLVSFGMGGEVAARSTNVFTPLGGTAAFLYASAAVFLRYRSRSVRLELDAAPELQVCVTNVAVGNGRFHGGGMQVCPRAVLDDGLFDITVIGPLGMLELIKDVRVLYSDDIYQHPKVTHFRTSRLKASAEQLTHLEIDGEPLGTLPLEISILPRRLRLIVHQNSPLLDTQENRGR